MNSMGVLTLLDLVRVGFFDATNDQAFLYTTYAL